MYGSKISYGLRVLDKVQISLNVVCVAGLALAGFAAWHNHVKRKTERAEA